MDRKSRRLPVIDLRMYQILLKECDENCIWGAIWPWHDCLPPYISDEYITRLPKRKEAEENLLKSGKGVRFGNEVNYMLRLGVYRLVIVAPPFAFWVISLVKHPEDWQDASVPLVTVLALITVS
jgi:hypothetical protein